MQITKDDVKRLDEYTWWLEDYKIGKIKVLDFSKFQQVVEFFNTHQTPESLIDDKPTWYINWKEYCELENLENDDTLPAIYLIWLHNKCFVEGLK